MFRSCVAAPGDGGSGGAGRVLLHRRVVECAWDRPVWTGLQDTPQQGHRQVKLYPLRFFTN